MRVARLAVRAKKRESDMPDLPREALRKIRERAGYSASKVARALSYASASGYARYEQEAVQGDKKIPHDVVRRLVPLFRGAGNPPVTEAELLAISDLSDGLPKPVVQAFAEAALVESRTGSLVVRHKVAPDVYVKYKEDQTGKQLGASVIGASPSYPPTAQFAAAVSSDLGDYKAGSQVHCVTPDQIGALTLPGQEVLVAEPYAGTDLASITLGRVLKVQHGEAVIVSLTGGALTGTIIGVVVGAYRKYL